MRRPTYGSPVPRGTSPPPSGSTSTGSASSCSGGPPRGSPASTTSSWSARPAGGWHFELTRDPEHPVEPTPTVEDLFVVYLGAPVEEEQVERLIAAGGTRIPAHNPYWDEYGVTVADPDGYQLVLCSRSWG